MTASKAPRPLPADEQALIEAWHGPESTAEVALDLGIKGSELDYAWRRLKREGKLPPSASRQRAYAKAERTGEHERSSADDDASAALLDALFKVHGNDNETGERADIYPGLEKKRT